MRTLGSAHRLNAVRGPRASGHPPWEPAEKPVSELPWMDAPGSTQNRMVPPRRVFPVGTEGQAAGSASGLGASGLDGSGLGVSDLGAGETGTGGTGTGRPASTGPADPGPSMTASGLVRRRPKSQSPFPDLDGPPAGVGGPPAGLARPPAGVGGPPAGLARPSAGLESPPAGLARPSAGLESPPARPARPSAGLEGPPAGRAAEDAEDPRPMYSWNPSDPTEAFPAVPPPGDSRPG